MVLICLLQLQMNLNYINVSGIDSIDDVDDVEFIGLSPEKMRIIYEMMDSTSNTYLSNIYSYSNF